MGGYHLFPMSVHTAQPGSKPSVLASISGERQPKSIYMETFGCQMNELDSELVRGHLKALGYTFTTDMHSAEVVIYNTCSVREQAENKVWSRLGIHGLQKREGAEFVLGVIGCMAERDGTDMIRKFPQVDLMCGPGELDKLPMLIENALKTAIVDVDSDPAKPRHSHASALHERIALQGNTSRRASTLEAVNDNLELLDLSRAFDPDHSSPGAAGKSAYVRITRGCNKFCTYCVVPYTRGAEVHRPPDAIIDECRKLADAGVIEVTLLGQTVNHYIYTHGAAVNANGVELPQVGPGAAAFKDKNPLPLRGEGRVRGESNDVARSNDSTLTPALSFKGRGSKTTTFADLLKRIHDEVPAIQRLRFVTSFPRDFGDDILHVMADSPRICRYLHVPAQSGSNRILKLMNRGYTVEQYIDFIGRARTILNKHVGGVCIAGDIIVGFPTETEDDFERTKDLLRTVRFKNNFIFKYSPRPGTVAIDRFEDDVPESVKRRRNNELLALQSEISASVHAEFVGKTVDVFVEHATEKAESRKQKAESPASGVALTVSAKTSGVPTSVDTNAAPAMQLSGRTGGDLIAVFDLPPNATAEQFIGRVVPVQITSSASLLLRGHLV